MCRVLIIVAALMMSFPPAPSYAGELFSINFGRRDTNDIRSRSLFRSSRNGYFDGRLSRIRTSLLSTQAEKKTNPLNVVSFTNFFSGDRSNSGQLEDVNPFEANRFEYLQAKKAYEAEIAARESGEYGGSHRSAKLRSNRAERRQQKLERLKRQRIARKQRKKELEQRNTGTLFAAAKPQQQTTGAPKTNTVRTQEGQSAQSTQTAKAAPKAQEKVEDKSFWSKLSDALFG